VLGGRCQELSGSSVVIAMTDQLIAAAALIELDGVARRMVLCPPDLPAEYLPSIVRSAEADAIVSDRIIRVLELPGSDLYPLRWKNHPQELRLDRSL
jgi:hypothetical protein